jgi:hypothetical protein
VSFEACRKRKRTEANATEGVRVWFLITAKWKKATRVTTMGEAFLLPKSGRAPQRESLLTKSRSRGPCRSTHSFHFNLPFSRDEKERTYLDSIVEPLVFQLCLPDFQYTLLKIALPSHELTRSHMRFEKE